MEDATPFDRCFDGHTLDAFCTSVYDGDTIKVIVSMPGSNDGRRFLVNCRLTGIDTAEMRGTRGDEKQKAIDARDMLRGWILNQQCRVECGRLDKYGRLLIQVYAFDDLGTTCNQRLIDAGLALAYDGGTKKSHTPATSAHK